MKNKNIIIDKYESVNRYKNDGQPFFQTEKYIETVDSLEEYKNLTSELSLKSRIDLIFKSIGINPEKLSLYNKLIKLVQFVPFVMPNFNLLLLGDKGTFKSSPYHCYSNYAHIISGIPSKAELRGAKNISDSIALLEKLLLIIEEIADDTSGTSLPFMKESFQSRRYEDRDGKEKITTTSVVFIGNNYLTIDNIEDLREPSIINGGVPKALTDEAFLDRINAVIYTDEKFKLKDSLFLGANDEGLHIHILMKSFLELRQIEYNIDFNQSYNEPRDNSRVLATVKGLCKILYPNNDAPIHVIEGLANFALHLRYIGREFKLPFPSSSIKFLIDAMNLCDIEEFCLLSDRILIKKHTKQYFEKIALCEWGMEKNRLELDFFKSINSNVSTSIANININNSTNFIIEQEYYPLYSNKHTFSFEGSLIKKEKENYVENAEFNLLLIEKIKFSVMYPNHFSFPKNKLRPWKEFKEDELVRIVKKALNIECRDIHLKKSTYSYENGNNFKLINFSEYLIQ